MVTNRNKKFDGFDGEDRRSGLERRICQNAGSCFSHSGIDERVKASETKLKSFEDQNFVPFSNYKWSIGILASILLSLFSISIYLSLSVNSALNQISAKQETTIYKISVIQKEIEELKKASNDELKEIKRKIHQHNTERVTP